MTGKQGWARQLYAHGIALDLDAGRMTLQQAAERLQVHLQKAKQARFPELVRQVEADIESLERARLRVC